MVKDFDRKEVCVMCFCVTGTLDKLVSVKSISDQRHQQSEFCKLQLFSLFCLHLFAFFSSQYFFLIQRGLTCPFGILSNLVTALLRISGRSGKKTKRTIISEHSQRWRIVVDNSLNLSFQ